MENKEYFIYLNGEKIPVSEEVYRAYYRQIWRVRDHAKRHGGCCCADWKKCIGDCGICRYHTGGACLSLDRFFEEAGDSCDVLRDPLANGFEDRIAEEDGLARKLASLTDEDRAICETLIEELSEREAAEATGLSKTQYHRKKTALITRLQIEWVDLL